MKPRSAILFFCSVLLSAMAAAGAASACSAPQPAPGAIISGPVLAVPDSHTLCVATGPDPSQWVALRIAAPEPDLSVSMVMAAVFAKRVSCVVGPQGAAQCRVGQEDVRTVLGRPTLRTVAMAWR